LRSQGFDAVHVRQLNMQTSTDEAIFILAKEQSRIILSADTDFGTLLALRGEAQPSLILFRHGTSRNPVKQLSLLNDNLNMLKDFLTKGSVIVFEAGRIRIRPLPIGKNL
jgi:predicted nuclease of predicted toxin-antitoxin system